VEKVLRNTAATITVTFYNGSSPAEADGAVTVTAVKGDGTTLFTLPATNEIAVGVYSIVIPPQAALNTFVLTWAGTFTGTPITIETDVEIVGGFYFSIAELRGFDKVLENTTRFPTDALVNARDVVETEFEDICARAFVQRYHREEALVPDTDTALLWTEKPEVTNINSVTVDGVDQTAWVAAGYFKRDKYSPRALVVSTEAQSALYANDVTMEYEYGMRRVPRLIKEKALKRAKQFLVGQNSTMDERATTMLIPDVGTVNLATPGMRGSETGVPDIDVVLERFKIDGGAGVY
jgi:hypothetical protein